MEATYLALLLGIFLGHWKLAFPVLLACALVFFAFWKKQGTRLRRFGLFLGLLFLIGLLLYDRFTPEAALFALPRQFSKCKIHPESIRLDRGQERLVFSCQSEDDLHFRLLSDLSLEEDLDRLGERRQAVEDGSLFSKTFRAELKTLPFNKDTLPQAFNQEAYYRAKGIQAKAEVQVGHFVKKIWSWDPLLQRGRFALRRAIGRLKGESRYFLEGLILGESSKQASLKDHMKALGLSHLLAASGLHISFLFQGLLFFLAFLPIRRWQADLGIFLLLFFYAGILHFPASILRALVFTALEEYALLRRKKLAGAKKFLFTASILLLFSPYRLGDAGFLLSFACVFAMSIASYLNQARPIRSALLRSLDQSLWINLLTWPLLAQMGMSLSFSSIFANILAIPAFSPLFALGLGEILLSGLPFLGALFAKLFSLAYLLFSFLIYGLEAFLYQEEIYLTPRENLLYYLFVALLFLAVSGKLHHFFLQLSARDLPSACFRKSLEGQALAGILFVASFSFFSDFLFGPVVGFYALDVGQGDCLLLKTKQVQLLFDTGGRMDFRTKENTQAPSLVAELRRLGVESLDGVFLSHKDYDHVGNLRGLLEGLPVDAIYRAPAKDPKNAPDYPCPQMEVKTGLAWALGGGAQPGSLHVLEEGQWDAEDKNNHSMLLFLNLGIKIILLGDLEKDLPFLPRFPKAPHLLKIGHHGARKATSQALLDQIQPTRVVISAGRNNRYGHPTPEVLERLKKAGIPYDRTDLLGTICYLHHPWLEKIGKSPWVLDARGIESFFVLYTLFGLASYLVFAKKIRRLYFWDLPEGDGSPAKKGPSQAFIRPR